MNYFVLQCTNQYIVLSLSSGVAVADPHTAADFETFNYVPRIRVSAGKRQTGFVV